MSPRAARFSSTRAAGAARGTPARPCRAPSASPSAHLGSLAQTRELAETTNRRGRFDAVIHNAGIGYREQRRLTEDGLERVFQINVLAPYVLTALIDGPKRLVYLSSGMRRSGEIALDDVDFERRRWSGTQACADSKLLDVLLAFAVARLELCVSLSGVELAA